MTPRKLSLTNLRVISEITGFLAGYIHHNGKLTKATLQEILSQTLDESIADKTILSATSEYIAHVLSSDYPADQWHLLELATENLTSENIELNRTQTMETLHAVLYTPSKKINTKHSSEECLSEVAHAD